MTAGRAVPESELVLANIAGELREVIAVLLKMADGIDRALRSIDEPPE